MHRFAALALLASIVLVGCAPTGEADPTATDAGTPPPTAAPAATDQPPATAGATPDPELDAFLAALSGQSPADPDALVAAIEAAGFPRATLERTREVDSLGAPVTFLEIAARTDGGCIIGQVGDGEPMAVRAAPLGGGRCLVGGVVTVD